MEDRHNIQAIAAPAGNPGQWLAAYLHRRAHLASCESDFHCDPDCTRPGCKNQDLQVPVSIIDLLGAAGHRGESLSATYRQHYSLGLLSDERQDWIRTVSLRLRKPCPFLENDRCGIYPVRPLPCMLFPEYLVQAGTFEANAGQEHFRDYLCLRRPLLLSAQRAAVIAQLRKMWARESLISSFYLFNHGPCRFDFHNLTRELLDEAERLQGARAGEMSEPLRIIPNQVMEGFFLERLAGFQPFAGTSEKIGQLDNREGQARFLEFFQDDLLLKKLKKGGNDRALIFRLVKGKVQAKRRSLIPAEYNFYG